MNHPAILETTEAFGETTLIAESSQIVDLCRYLKDSEKFLRLSAVTAVDWHPEEPRFEVVYHLHSIERNQRLRIKCRLSGNSGADPHPGDPEIESVTAVWRGANWYEREVYDMFGIRFRNHPNLVRILMPVDWEGYPLRKDYPVHGYKYGYGNE
jgi:NADH-quinone oxidoreductase subunit C